MPWLRLSFMLTITSRGCIFLSPLHFGVVTLPREFMPGTNDDYVRPHTYVSLCNDVVTSSASRWRDQRLSPSPTLSIYSRRFNSRRRESSARSIDVHTNELEARGERREGLRQSRIVASLRRTLLHCARSASLSCRFSESPEPVILISQFFAIAHTGVTIASR